MDPAISPANDIEEPPPFLCSWPRVYMAVVVYMIVLIALLFVATRYFTY
jgi:hypothetical protein